MRVSRSYSRHGTQGAIPSPPNWLQKNRFAKSKAAAAPWDNWYSYTSSKNTPPVKMEYLSSDCRTHTGLAFFAGWVKKKNFLLYPHLILTQLGKIPRQNHLESLLFFNSLFLGWFSTVITTLCYVYSQQGGLVGEGDWHAILTAYIHSIPGTHSGRRELTAYPWE